MSVVPERLEDLLFTVEDLCMNRELALRVVGRGGEVHAMVANWRNLRKRLLQSKTIFDDGEYAIPHAVINESPELMCVANVPWEVHLWTHRSRRIYAVNAALQEQFLNADYSGLTWDQIHLPFGSFIIELETPLVENEFDPPAAYDAFLVTRVENGSQGTQIRNRLLRQKDLLGEYRGFERAWLRDDLDRGKLRDAIRRKRRIDEKISQNKGSSLVLQGAASSSIYAEEMPEPRVRVEQHDIYEIMRKVGLSLSTPIFRTRDWRCLSQTAKITVGLCLYLEHVAKSSVGPEFVRVPSSGSRANTPPPIADEALLCRVLNEGVLNVRAIQKKLNRRSARSGKPQGPQARTGHWKRPRGKGDDPEHPKSIWIDDYKTHPELLEGGGIVGGTRTKIDITST